ncbi:hypothetical protein D0B54_21265 [Solimonas sp. K1W22B-7]|uniref:hypothetical protein n=1 Tax=Solimonas sp. K1W22B-7 TaxID=2303331 RepID=UPI000E33471F|nr:hypothetical protein [Solimonas sp. K1W22B-7]AXQ31052.1 hypothetical protein D0B54_21265 [Solimonas sp. K1W22B-7]
MTTETMAIAFACGLGMVWALSEVATIGSQKQVLLIMGLAAGYVGGALYLLSHRRALGVTVAARLLLSIAGLGAVIYAGLAGVLPPRTALVVLLCGAMGSLPLLPAGIFKYASRHAAQGSSVIDDDESRSYEVRAGIFAFLWSVLASMPLLGFLAGDGSLEPLTWILGGAFAINACTGVASLAGGVLWFLGQGVSGMCEFLSSPPVSVSQDDDSDDVLQQIQLEEDLKRLRGDD